MNFTIARISTSVSDGFAPDAGMGTPVVFCGSSAGRPRLMNSTSSTSPVEAMNSLTNPH